MTDDRMDRLIAALEAHTNAVMRLTQQLDRRASKADKSLKVRARPVPANDVHVTDSVRQQVARALRKYG